MELRERILQTLPEEARDYIATLERKATEAETWRERYSSLETRYETLEEEYRLLVFRRFGRSAEQVDLNQSELFGEAEVEAGGQANAPVAEKTVVSGHTRERPGRKPIASHIPRVEILHDISEEDKACACGHELVRIGEETSERMAVIPEQMYVERHVRPKYACRHCEGSGDEEKPAVRIAPAPAQLIPGSIVTPGLLAFILVNKFCDHLPFYRQEARFERIGVHISRQDMSNWTIAAAGALAPLIERIRNLIRAGPIINMDETPVQVMGEAGRPNTSSSYMWLARGGPVEARVCLYHYEPSRSTDYPRRLLADYTGFLQADAFRVYKLVADEQPGITLVGCWAHVRRRFFEATKGSKKAGAAHEGLGFVTTLYRIQSELCALDLSDDEFLRRRRQATEPHLAKFRTWLTRAPSARPDSDERMKPLIRIAHKAGRGSYGPRRIQTELQATGTFLGQDQIARLRREMGLKCIQKRKFKATTNSSHSLPVAENLLDQQFSVTDPGTECSTDEGWLYLAGVKDLATKEIIGYAMGTRMTKELTHTALDRAVRYRKPEPGCIHHSDRGSQLGFKGSSQQKDSVRKVYTH